jgi:hypothetical protein
MIASGFFQSVSRVIQKRDQINREKEKFFSSELDAKISRFEELMRELSTLEKEISNLVGEPLERDAPQGSVKAKGPRKGGTRLKDSEVVSEIQGFLNTNSSLEGVSCRDIATNLQKNVWSAIPISTVYSKVTKALIEDENKQNRRFRSAGDSRKRRWFVAGNE